jgi:hypothetical protein
VMVEAEEVEPARPVDTPRAGCTILVLSGRDRNPSVLRTAAPAAGRPTGLARVPA